jgi:hypothetical protein
MRRDLMLLRAREAQKEAQETAAISIGDEKTNAIPNGKVSEVGDLTMTDAPSPSRETAPEISELEAPKAETANSVPPTPITTNPPVTADALPTTTAADLPAKADELAPKTPTTADGMKDMDFESMFGDLAGDSPNNDTVNSIDMNDFPDTNADVSSLLPGLENYAAMPDTTMPETTMPETTTDNTTNLDSGLDFSMPPIPDQNPLDQDTNTAEVQGDDQQGDGNAQGDFGDNSFEDLFDMDYEFSTTAGNTDDLDDWMKTWDE